MGFGAERAEGHCLRAETLDDGSERLDFVERDSGVGNGVKQIAEEDGALVFRQFFEGGICFCAGCADVGVETADDFGRTGVEFGAFAETEEAGIGKVVGIAGEGRLVNAQIIGEEIVERFLAGKIGGVFENFGAEMFGEADDFKEMAVAIAGQGGDAHAGENFSETGVDGGAGFFEAAGFERLGKFIGEIRDDGAGACGDEERDMMGVEDLGGFDD